MLGNDISIYAYCPVWRWGMIRNWKHEELRQEEVQAGCQEFPAAKLFS